MRRLNSNELLIGLLVAGLLFCGEKVRAADHISLSPNKQWEYQCSADGSKVGIVKAGTTESVLELSFESGEKAAEASNVVWAPDSNRFAFNHWDGYKASGTDLY